YPMDSARARLSRITAMGMYRKQKKLDEDLGEKEASLRRRFSDRFRDEVEATPPPEKFTWWQRETARLEAKYASSEMESERNLAARIQNFLFAMPFEASNPWRRQNQYDKSRYCARLLTVLFPENAYARVRLAEEYALIQKEGEMIASLQMAKQLGYSDVSSLRDNPLFQPYLHRDDFPFHAREQER
ncbi:MAG: hypothetical protein R3252_11975, partial [Robiginitalea sp.]|nr:hypothetical protein [Robiginitalea sp.]